MTKEIFFANFGYLADAPNGVKKLRELILQLAVQGKLVPQDPNDEPASKLLERIKAEKARLLKEKKIKKNEALPPFSLDEVPYELPKVWAWVRLGEVIQYDAAEKVEPKKIQDDSWLLELEDIEKESSRILQRLTFGKRQSKSNKARFITGDLLYGKLRPYLNKVVVADADGYCTTEIIALRSYVDTSPEYLKFALKSPYFFEYVNSKTYGVKMPRLGTNDGRMSLIPLPPLAEQHRIVAKVGQLMSLCDELETRQQKEKQKLVNLNNAALDRLLTARTPDVFANAWRLIRDNFDFLYTAPETIGKLRQAILQLAVQGKLVPQNPKDEPASVLLAKIKAEKERLVKEKKIKKSEPLQAVDPDAIPYELPEGWEWVRLPDITYDCGQKIPDVEFTYIDVSAIDNKLGVVTDEVVVIQPDDAPSRARKLVRLGSVIYSTVRPYLLNIAIIDKEFQPAPIVSTAFAVLHPYEGIVGKFLFYYLRSRPFIDYVEAAMTGMAYPAINDTKLQMGVIPLPPIAEQHRIITMVDQLMNLCDELEAKLSKSQTKSEKLVEAAVKAITAN